MSDMSGGVTRQPLNLSVDRIADRIAGVNQIGGYQIINTSLEATVWVAANPSVQDGIGTSIPPGTSLRWTTADDVWIVLGADTQSVAAGQAAIIVSYDTYDWAPSPAAVATAVAIAIFNQGILIVDDPVTLISSGIGPGTYPSTTTYYDVSRYNSLLITTNSTTPPGNCRIILNWYDNNNNLIASRDIRYGPGLTSWNATVPVIGSKLQVVVTAGIVFTQIVASYRVSTFAQQAPGGGGQLVGASGNINNGVGLTYDIPPWFGEVEIRGRLVIPTAGAVSPYGTVQCATYGGVDLQRLSLGVTAAGNYVTYGISIDSAFGTTVAAWKFSLAMNGYATQVAIANISGVNGTFGWGAFPINDRN